MYINNKVLIGCFIYTLSIAIDIVHYYNFLIREFESSRKEETASVTTKISKVVSLMNVFFSPVLIVPRLTRAYLFFHFLCAVTKEGVFVSLAPLIITFPSGSLMWLLTIVAMECTFSMYLFIFLYKIMH